MTERRRHEDNDEFERLRRIVRDELHSTVGFQSLRKNGDTWTDWVQRVITPERILWLLMAIFILGGRAERVTTDLATANTRTSELAKQLDDTRALIDQQTEMLGTQIQTLQRDESNHATKADLAAVVDQLRLTVKRDEYQSTIRTQIIPRLERIEQRLQP